MYWDKFVCIQIIVSCSYHHSILWHMYVELSWKITWGQFPFVWKTIKWLFFLLSLHFLLLEVSEGTCFCFYVTTFKNICLVFEFSNLVFISFLFQCLFPDLDIFFNVAILNKIVAEFPPATTTVFLTWP